jgi:hypothetical protein
MPADSPTLPSAAEVENHLRLVLSSIIDLASGLTASLQHMAEGYDLPEAERYKYGSDLMVSGVFGRAVFLRNKLDQCLPTNRTTIVPSVEYDISEHLGRLQAGVRQLLDAVASRPSDRPLTGFTSSHAVQPW